MLQVCQMDFLADSVFFPTCVSTHDSSICLGSSSMSTVADWQLFWYSRIENRFVLFAALSFT
jgi:hypothetical protein